MDYQNTIAFAREQDEKDSLKHFRDKFYIPIINGKESIYLTGNSLGLQPKTVQDYVLDELEDWASYGVEGHLHSRNPWLSYHEMFPPLLKKLAGADENEIVVMNQLTVNLHVLLTTFYRPSKTRWKIICESKAFPSDQYAFESQVKLHGLNPSNAILEIAPKEGFHTIETNDIISAIKKHGNETALVLFSGVNYYNGQVFDMKAITVAAHECGAFCGFDLAHAIGNVPLQLHDWDVDFACWCSYKYLNSGPGGVAGAFIHERHIANPALPRMAGWWGHDKASRFLMDKNFNPIPTAEGWQLSNAPVLSMAAHKASLDIFNEAGIENIFSKSRSLSGYLFYILDQVNRSGDKIEIITPRKEKEHGCQVSMLMKSNGKKIFDHLKQQGVMADWREPDVIRVAPVGLYNTFEDVFRFGDLLTKINS
ncbi:MAG TPA: kynureninase [Ferruginibacter sp.]|nr:kynureninase [Ferruginibacter sp.]